MNIMTAPRVKENEDYSASCDVRTCLHCNTRIWVQKGVPQYSIIICLECLQILYNAKSSGGHQSTRTDTNNFSSESVQPSLKTRILRLLADNMRFNQGINNSIFFNIVSWCVHFWTCWIVYKLFGTWFALLAFVTPGFSTLVGVYLAYTEYGNNMYSMIVGLFVIALIVLAFISGLTGKKMNGIQLFWIINGIVCAAFVFYIWPSGGYPDWLKYLIGALTILGGCGNAVRCNSGTPRIVHSFAKRINNRITEIVCSGCDRGWDSIKEFDQRPSMYDRLMMHAFPDMHQGYVCKKCSTILCERCFLMSSRACPECGSHDFADAWLRDAGPIDVKDMHRRISEPLRGKAQ